MSIFVTLEVPFTDTPPESGGLPYESDGDARHLA